MTRTFQQNTRIETAPLQDEGILFDPVSSKFFQLNRTSAFIWEHLATPATAESLVDEICQSFEQVTQADALADVQAALDELLALELVVANEVC